MELVLGWLILAIVVGVVASSRGRSGFGWFLISVLLSPLIGLILAVALPKVGKAAAPRDESGALISPATHVRCPDCREVVRRDARKCKHCGATLIPSEDPQIVSPEKKAAYDAERKKINLIFGLVVAGVIAGLVIWGSFGNKP